MSGHVPIQNFVFVYFIDHLFDTNINLIKLLMF